MAEHGGEWPTIRDVYEAVQRLERRLGGVPDTVRDHESRLRKVEAWRYALPPTLLLALFGAVSAAIN